MTQSHDRQDGNRLAGNAQERAGAAAGESPAAPSPSALDGVRVIELGALIAGPWCAALLAQFGAEVIKIESPRDGDPLRKWRKLYRGTSVWWHAQSRNKKSVTLNLKSARGQDIVRELVRDADIVIENFRPGQLEEWGLGWPSLSALNPRLVMVRISGFGQTGPYHHRPGFAAIAEAMGGFRHLCGYPDRPPVRTGISIGDTLAGMYGTIGALLAMHHVRSNRGAGQYIDVALYEAVFGVMESLLPEYSAFGHVRERTGASLPGIVPSSTYPCMGGAYVVIAGNSDGIYRRLMQAIGHPELADDPRLADNAGRSQHTELIDGAIAGWTRTRALEDVLAALDGADVPVGRIYTVADIAHDPHFLARGMIEQHTLPDGQGLSLPGIVPKLSATPGRTRWLGPTLGEHTAEVLAGLGLDAAALAALRADGVI